MRLAVRVFSTLFAIFFLHPFFLLQIIILFTLPFFYAARLVLYVNLVCEEEEENESFATSCKVPSLKSKVHSKYPAFELEIDLLGLGSGMPF